MRSSHRTDVEHVADGLLAEEILAGVDEGFEILESARRLRDEKKLPSPEAIKSRQQRSRVLARLEALDRLRERPGISDLSRREIEVVALIARGYTNVEFAKQLWISEETAKSHVRHILAKLEARNRAHAVALAIGRGLIEPPTERDA